MKTIYSTLLASMLALTLSACGGGGNSDTPATTATSLYTGAWKTSCHGSDVTTTIGGTPLNEQYTLTSTASTASSVTYTVVNRFYAFADTNCTSTSLGNETTVGMTIVITGTTTIAGNVVDKVTFTVPAITGLVMGNLNMSGTNLGSAAVTASNGVYFQPNHFIARPEALRLMRLTATQWFIDDRSGTPTTYPTGMSTAVFATKI